MITYILNDTMAYVVHSIETVSVPRIERTNSLQQDKIIVNRLLLVTGEPLLNIINSLGHARDNYWPALYIKLMKCLIKMVLILPV